MVVIRTSFAYVQVVRIKFVFSSKKFFCRHLHIYVGMLTFIVSCFKRMIDFLYFVVISTVRRVSLRVMKITILRLKTEIRRFSTRILRSKSPIFLYFSERIFAAEKVTFLAALSVQKWNFIYTFPAAI